MLNRPVPERKLFRLLVAVTVADCLVALLGPAALLLANWPDSWPHRVIFVGALVSVVVLPMQCTALWRALRPQSDEQHRVHVLQQRVHAVLESRDLQIAFQPVRSVITGQIVAVEALSRFSAEPHQTPDRWFADAAQVGLGIEMELLALQLALSNAALLDSHLDVAVNLSPAALQDPLVFATLVHSEISPLRLIVEITEHAIVSDYTPLCRSRCELRAQGIRLAIDDAGAGYASFSHIVSLAPDLIKLDRSIIAGLDSDPARLALVRSVVGFAAECNSTTIAEGVETPGELASITALGVDSVQGYFTGRPSTDPDGWSTWIVCPLLGTAHERAGAALSRPALH